MISTTSKKRHADFSTGKGPSPSKKAKVEIPAFPFESEIKKIIPRTQKRYMFLDNGRMDIKTHGKDSQNLYTRYFAHQRKYDPDKTSKEIADQYLADITKLDLDDQYTAIPTLPSKTRPMSNLEWHIIHDTWDEIPDQHPDYVEKLESGEFSKAWRMTDKTTVDDEKTKEIFQPIDGKPVLGASAPLYLRKPIEAAGPLNYNKGDISFICLNKPPYAAVHTHPTTFGADFRSHDDISGHRTWGMYGLLRETSGTYNAFYANAPWEFDKLEDKGPGHPEPVIKPDLSPKLLPKSGLDQPPSL